MYHTIQNQTKPNLTIPNQTKFPYIGHNSVVFQIRISKFCMELHLDFIHLPYVSKPNQTRPAQQTTPNMIEPNQTGPNQVRPNQTKLNQEQNFGCFIQILKEYRTTS